MRCRSRSSKASWPASRSGCPTGNNRTERRSPRTAAIAQSRPSETWGASPRSIRLTLDAEMPLPIVGDLRAWDAAIAGDSWTMYVDAETRIRDVQSLARRTSLKHRDTGRGHVLLLVADTRANRAVLDSIRSPLVDEALTGRRIIEALAAGVDPGGNGVLLL